MGRRRADWLLHVLTGIMVGILLAFAIFMMLAVVFFFWYGTPPS